VSVSGLVAGATRQLSLETPANPGWDEADEAVDSIRARFGESAIVPATLVGPAGVRVKRRGDQQWGPGDEAPPTAPER
jgi:hypothetical protein